MDSKQIRNEAKTKVGWPFPAKTINGNGNVVDKLNSYFYHIEDPNVDNDGFIVGNANTNTEEGRLLGRELVVLLTNITNIGVYTDYKNVKNSIVWKKLYGVKTVGVNFYNIDGSVNRVENLECTFCHWCGIQLPLELIQVDHVMPQATATEGFALMKLFHMLNENLTEEKGKGSKFNQIKVIQNSNLVGYDTGLNPIKTKAYSWKNPWVNKGADLNRDNRYKLTTAGEVLLNFLIYVAGQLRYTGCVNSLINLVPSCSKCNGSKNDKIHIKKI